MADPSAADPSSLFELLRTQVLAFEEVRRAQDLLIEQLLPTAQRGTGVPAAPPDDGPTALLRQLQLLLLKHPVAAQAAFSALVAEGRRFAATPEGAAWKSSLASSDLVRKGRQLWDALTLNLLEEDASTVVPSAYLEAIFRVATSPELEAVLRELRESLAGAPHGTP